jgi:hypothetical protein
MFLLSTLERVLIKLDQVHFGHEADWLLRDIEVTRWYSEAEGPRGIKSWPASQ